MFYKYSVKFKILLADFSYTIKEGIYSKKQFDCRLRFQMGHQLQQIESIIILNFLYWKRV